jgi:hypothetical protein
MLIEFYFIAMLQLNFHCLNHPRNKGRKFDSVELWLYIDIKRWLKKKKKNYRATSNRKVEGPEKKVGMSQ